MTTVAPPPPTPLPAALGSAPQLTISLTGDAALVLSKVALDGLINSLVKPPAANGDMVLQTNLGTLQFKSPFNLPTDAQATFKLVQTQPNVQIQLTHINGKPIQPNTPAARVMSLATPTMTAPSGLLQGQQQSVQNQAIQTGNAPASTFNVNTASGLKAFVLSPQPNAAQTTQTQGQAQQPMTSNVGAQTTKPTTSATGQLQNTASPTTTTPATNTINIQPGNQLNVRLLSVQQPGQTNNNVQANAPTSQSTVIIQGNVQGQTAAKQPIVQTSQGRIALETTAKMPDGTQVKMEVLSSSKPPMPLQTATPALQNTLQMVGQKWPALEEAFQTLHETNPNLAEQLSKAILPKADQRLAANMVFFLKALGRGTLKNWVDDQGVRALARIKPGLLKKLEGDFQNLADKAKSPTSTDWKIAYVPMQNNGDINQIRIAQRDHRDEENNKKEDPGVRFVIDINLSRFGELQFDGLAKDKMRRFDLIIRAKSALPGFVRKEIHDIFENGMDAIGFDGKISFQVTSRFVDVDALEQQNSALNLGMLV